jgi:hypothetical protein
VNLCNLHLRSIYLRSNSYQICCVFLVPDSRVCTHGDDQDHAFWVCSPSTTCFSMWTTYEVYAALSSTNPWLMKNAW